VLCELEGRTRKEVARQLNLAEGTLSSRLAAARKALAKRLRRHGWTGPGGAAAPAGLPVPLFTSTARAAALVLAGRGAAGVVSARVIALSEGVIHAMFLNKLKVLVMALGVVGALSVGTGRLTHLALAEGSAAAQEAPRAPAEQVRRAADELAAAQAALKQAEANLAAAKGQVAQREAEYQNALRRTEPRGDRGEAGIRAAALADRFKYRVPVEIGFTQNQDGGRIEILEVWGTRPRIEIGGQYLVHGRYVLPGPNDGTLYLHVTSSGSWDNTGPELDLQYTRVKKGQGEFTLLHALGGTGYFHLHLIAEDQGKGVTYANVYFGTGDTVWRKR
jgi:hypothetical protein